ncbi:C40 family peptidase [Mycobacterium attenuatum]|uniref:C40 family peptidase n=1 Tax=Mycobacterium attenuatum TaxID=2341086 RepID=UPI000F02D0C4|nr:NlpC/P60 family protein [Mycobacterium attenuatum]
MTLDGLVSEAGEALGRARSLFGPAAFGVGFASTPALQGAGEQVGSGVGESAGSWQGGAGSGYRRRAGGTVRAVDSTIGADAGAGGGVVAGGDHATSGRAGANGVVQDARNGVAAIAPATGTRAGRDELVAHLQTQLARMRARLRAAEAQDLMLAQQIRAAGGGYGGAGMRGGAPALPGFGGGQAGSAGLGNTPGLSLPGLSSVFQAAQHGRRHRGSHDPRVRQAGIGSGGGPAAQQAVKAALTRLGRPYVWGAKGPDAFDCSGLVKWAYAQVGITVGDDTHAQIAHGMAVAPGDVTTGDAIFPSNEFGSNGPEHVMLAISPTQCIEASTSGVPVKISPMPSGFVARRYA